MFKPNKTANIVVAAFSLLIGLALIGVGIYLLAAGADDFSGGLLVGLGALVCVLFGCAVYLIARYDKLQEEAERKMKAQQEEMRAFIARKMEEAERLRSESERAESDASDAEKDARNDD